MKENSEKKFVLGQYWTRKEIVKRVIDLIQGFKGYPKSIRILEPAFGSGNFIEVLKAKGFSEITGCEIDPQFTETPTDFFDYPLTEKFDLIIGNPPFTKYNIKESYYYPKRHYYSKVEPSSYLFAAVLKKEKMQVENAFILKSIKHLKDKNSTIGFVLPISFFIKGKNLEIKKKLLENFSTIIVFQNSEKWVDEPIPCCFAIFTNAEKLKNKIAVLYEDGGNVQEILPSSALLTEELIPKAFFYRKRTRLIGTPLSKFLSGEAVHYKMSYTKNNVSASNILDRCKIPAEKAVEDYYLAVVRVGNGSVGRAGLVNLKEDVLNAMFYVFKFKCEFNADGELKEMICEQTNLNQEYFKSITFRVGSKSIRKDDVLNFKINPGPPR